MQTSRSSLCPECQRNYRLSRKKKLKDGEENPSTVSSRVYREKNPEIYLLCNPRQRAEKKGWEFNLTPEDVIIPTHCPVFGVKLDPVGSGTNYTPSIDRIDPSKGYIKGNIRVVSWRANTLLSDGSLKEFEDIVKFLKEKKEEE